MCVLEYLIDGQVADKSQGSLRTARSPFSLSTSYIYGSPPSLFPHLCSKLHVCVTVFLYSVEIYVAVHRASFPSVSRGFLCCGVIILRFFWFWGNFCVCFLVFSYCADSSNLSMLQCIAVCCSVLQRIAACCRVCDITHLFARDQRK